MQIQMEMFHAYSNTENYAHVFCPKIYVLPTNRLQFGMTIKIICQQLVCRRCGVQCMRRHVSNSITDLNMWMRIQSTIIARNNSFIYLCVCFFRIAIVFFCICVCVLFVRHLSCRFALIFVFGVNTKISFEQPIVWFLENITTITTENKRKTLENKPKPENWTRNREKRKIRIFNTHTHTHTT